MFDLRAIRDDPASFDAGWARRGLEAQTPKILKLDEERRAVQTRTQTLLAKRNELSRSIGEAKKRKDEAEAAALMEAVAAIKEELPQLEAGDLVAILDAGAYGFTLSSNYNTRPRGAEVLVEGRRAKVIRRRETVKDLLALER